MPPVASGRLRPSAVRRFFAAEFYQMDRVHGRLNWNPDVVTCAVQVVNIGGYCTAKAIVLAFRTPPHRLSVYVS